MPSRRDLDRFRGRIASAGHASGDRVVVGAWHASPLGPFADVMWVRGDGRRTLLAPSQAVATYVGGLYAFDDVEVVGVTGRVDTDRVHVDAGPLRVRWLVGDRSWRSWVFAARPRWLREAPAWVVLEDRLVGPLGGLLIDGGDGVRLAGTTPGGRREWYAIADTRPLAGGSLTVGGRDAGDQTPVLGPLGVGLSDPPPVPSLTTLTTLIEAPGRPSSRAVSRCPAATHGGADARA